MRVQRWGRRGWTIFIVVVLALTAAVPKALDVAGVKNSWWAVPATLLAGLATLFAKPLWERLQRMSKRREATDLTVLDGCLVTASKRFPTVRQITDPRWLGVHSAAQLPDTDSEAGATETVPVYVPRDIDDELRARIAKGGFVLLVGDSTAGKSRTAYEAIHATIPDHVVIAPTNRDALTAVMDRAAITKNCVVWLNDLEHYLGTGGLTKEMVAKLSSGNGHRVIVATIRSVELSRLTDSSTEDTTHQAFRQAREVLELAGEIRVERRFSHAERERARDRTWDPRIDDALKHSDEYGLAEYLAAGPELLREWHNGRDVGAHPRGAALVTAAVEARRAGLTPPLPHRLLEELADYYLEEAGGDRLRPEPLAEAWNWALQPRRATTSLLTGSKKDGYDVFDYLLDTTQRQATTHEHFVAEHTLRTTLTYANGPAADEIASTAYAQGHYTIAADALQAAIAWHTDHLEPDHPDTLTSRNNLATVLHARGRLDEAEHELRTTLEARTRILGPEHPHTLTSRNNLAAVERSRKKHLNSDD